MSAGPPGEAGRSVLSSLHQVLIVGVFLDPCLHERALRDQLEAGRADLIECALHQLRADPLAAELLRHVGVLERDDAAVELVVFGGKMALDFELEAVIGLVVDDVAHVVWFSPSLWRAWNPQAAAPGAGSPGR